MTVNISASGEERVVRFLPAQKVEKLVSKLRQKRKFQEFEGKIAQKGKRVGKIRVLFDETDKIAILGIAAEGSGEKIAHQVRIKVKAGKDDEPEESAEPAIQATACGQATGEAVSAGARMAAQLYDPGEGATTDPVGGYSDEGSSYEGPQLCTSQWGYSYICSSFTPFLQVEKTGPLLLATFIGGQAQASFTIWNAGGRTLTGTATTTGPFTILSGGSFSLAPGQPQEVVVGFNPPQVGTFLGEVRFTNSTIKVSLEGKAYTFEEYLQILSELYNQLTNLSRTPLLPNRRLPPILYVPAARSFVFGFERLSMDVTEQMIQIAEELQRQSPQPDQPVPASSDSTVNEIELALQELSLYVNDPEFSQHLERIKARYPSFASLLVAVAILLGQEEIPVARELVALSQYQTSLWDLYVKILEKLISLGVIALVPPGQPIENCGVIGQTYPCSPQTRMAALSAFVSQLAFGYEQIGLSRGTAYMILESFLVAMDYILSGRGVAPGVNMKTLMEQLLNSIPFLNFEFFQPKAPPVDVIRDFVSLAQLLGYMVAYGQVGGQRAQWQFYAFGLNVEGGRIEIIATIKLSEFDKKPVTIFANTFDFFGESRNNIIQEAVNELNAAINYIREQGARYSQNNIAVGFVRSQIDDSTADSIMSQLQAGAPVLFVYCVANCDSGNPVYHP